MYHKLIYCHTAFIGCQIKPTVQVLRLIRLPQHQSSISHTQVEVLYGVCEGLIRYTMGKIGMYDRKQSFSRMVGSFTSARVNSEKCYLKDKAQVVDENGGARPR